MRSDKRISELLRTSVQGAAVRLLCASILVVTGWLVVTASPAVATEYVDGVSDQWMPAWLGSGFWEGGAPSQGTFAEFFGSSWTSGLGHIRNARYIAQWNAFTNGESGELSGRHVFEGWLRDASYYGLTPDLSLTNYMEEGHTRAAEHMPKSAREYEANLVEFLKWAQGVDPIRYVEAWNEPNAQGAMKGELSYEGNTWTAATAAEYTNVATKVCESYGCTVIAANLYDGGAGAVKYEEEYESHLAKAPAIWGVHPYWSVQQESESYVVNLEKAAKWPAHVWFTEVGAYYCYNEKGTMVTNGEAGQAERAEILTGTIISKVKPEHVFYYGTDSTTGKSTCSEGITETALFMGSAGGFQPRMAAGYIWANQGLPWGFTGGASNVTAPSGTLTGTVYPEGLGTKYHFEYGTTTGYGSLSGEGSVGSGEVSKGVTQTISGLTPGTTYHYRIVTWATPGHDTYGVDREFTTERTAIPATILTSNGEQYTFYRDQYDRLDFWYWNDTTWKHEWLGETETVGGNPSVVSRENGEKYVYYRGTNGRLYFWYWNDTTWKLEWLGETGAVAGEPKAIVKSNGEQYVYYRGTNGLLYFWYWNNSKWKLEWLGETGAVVGNPGPIVRENGEQYVYYEGSNGRLYYWYWNDTTWKLDWLGETGAVAGEPKAIVKSNGEQYVYYRGTSGRLYYWYWNDTTWKLEWLGETGAVVGNPGPIVRENGEQYVYYEGSNGRLYFWYWNDTTWKLEWLGETGAVAGDPKAVLKSNGEQYVYYGGTNGRLYFWYWNDTTWKLEWLGEPGELL